MTEDITSIPPLPADRRVPYGDDPSHFFDLWLPTVQSARGTVVMIHGGFWRSRYDLSHASHLCAALARNGLVAASLEYRRVGSSGGGWRGTYDDVLAGFDAARDVLPQSDRLVVLGHSAGGHLALRLAIDRVAVRGVVALAPVACLQSAYDLNLGNGAVAEFLGGSPARVPGAYRDACPSLHSSTVPRVLLHGSSDDVVPISISREFVNARGGDPGGVRLVEIERADHLALIDPRSSVFSTVLSNTLDLIGNGPDRKPA
jgi:alpha-beta hydrolase superfamily lysophospholipase